MKMILTVAGALAFSASPVLAQEAPSEKPKMCEMMHDGKKMQGMMKKDKDGKMSCQMMDHSKMDHSAHADMVAEPNTDADPAASAQTVTAKVNGLVCDFCAQAVRKVFKKQDAVEFLSQEV